MKETVTQKQNLLQCNCNRYPHINNGDGWVQIPVLNTYIKYINDDGCVTYSKLIKTEIREKLISHAT